MKHFQRKEKLWGSLSACFRRGTALLLAMSFLMSDGYAYAALPGDHDAATMPPAVQAVVSDTHLHSAEPEIMPLADDDQTITVSKFELEILDGYTRREDGGYVWNANTSADGHTFIFNVLFQTSGNGYIKEGAVKITLPKSVLRDKDGNFADLFEMSVPHVDQITDELRKIHDWAYYEDEDGSIVITNIKTIDAGQAYQFNVGYTTTETSFNYEDMKFFPIEATLDFDVQGSQIKDQKSTTLNVAIDTSVSIVQTNKRKPTDLYKEWNSLWGEKPEYADNYYYLIWDVETLVDEKSTQYYDFSLRDYDFRCTSPTGLNSNDLKIIGYNYSGNGNTYALQPDTVTNQSIFGTRHDFVLTAIPKAWYDQLKKDDDTDAIILENNVEATVTPVDGDNATKASSSQTYVLKLPEFAPPISNYKINKIGNRRTYQLDKFIDPEDKSELTPYLYDVTASGYSYADTYDYTPTGDESADYDPTLDYRNYGQKKLKYVLSDNEVSLEGYVGDFLKQYTLKKGEYYFTSVDFTYDINMVAKENTTKELPGNQSFDEERQSFNLTKPDSGSGYTIYFDICGEYYNDADGKYEYQKIATVQAYTGNTLVVTYESGMEGFASITNNPDKGFTITFIGDEKCTGYKIETSEDYYYNVSFTAKPGIQLDKNDAELLEWINKDYKNKNEADDNEDRVTELRLTNIAELTVSNADKKQLYDGRDSGTDYQNESTKESSITKSITAANNNSLYKRYEISWRIDISEYVLVSNGSASRVPVTQYGGEFFDLLPRGSSVDLSTVQVYREGNEPVEFTAKTLPGADNRVLLRVTVDADQPGEKYALCFTSYHSWEDIAAFGSNILNPAAYVSGNDDMADTAYKDAYKRGRYTGDSMELMVDSINSAGGYTIISKNEDGTYYGDTYDRTIFNYEPFDIKAVVMSNVGVNKTVKNATEGSYTTKTIIDESDGEYSYRLRFENGTTTKSINNVFVDFLETFKGGTAQVSPAWAGMLKSIDVSNLLSKNTIPRVYYSTDTFMINESDVWYTDSVENKKTYIVSGEGSGTYADGDRAGDKWIGIRSFLPQNDYENANNNAHWTLIDPNLCTNGVYDLSSLADIAITAIAIDFTYADKTKFSSDQIEDTTTLTPEEDNANAKITSDNKYIMGTGEAAYVIVNMDNSKVAPPVTRDEFNGTDAEYEAYVNGYNTYNDIFFASSVFNKSQISDNAQDNWLEQNYTTVSYRIRSDFYARKVNADHTDETIGGITFNLSGTSYYGTNVNINITTNSNGILEFEDLEVGVYTLIEVDCGRDWQIDRTEYTVTVNSDKTVTVAPDNSSNGDHSKIDNPFIVTNKPRAHADIVFDKNLYENGEMFDIGVEGAVFKLSGLSDYGNDIVKIAVSGYSGQVLFEDVEQGTYELTEIEAPEGYVLSSIVYTVRVDEHGNWSITATTPLLEGDSSKGYRIGNEKYQEFYLQKRSTQAVGKAGEEIYLLEGAEFNLYGVTDGGRIVNMDAVTGFSADFGEGIAYFGKLEPGTYYLRETKAPVYSYINSAGEEAEQRFYLDETIYTVKVTTSGVEITDPNGKPLAWAVDSEGKRIDEMLYDFPNVPVGGLVVVRKVWIDNFEDDDPEGDNPLTASEKRAKEVESPNIVISRDAPDPFENKYAIFDYSYSNGRLGNMGSSLNTVKLSIRQFKRYTGRVTFSETETVEANDTTYPRLLIDGNDVGAVVISKKESETIYGWLDADGTYYWYTKATGAKLLTAQDMFTNSTLEYADFSGVDFSETTSLSYMFSKCSKLYNVENLTRPADAVSATAANMFFQCETLGYNADEEKIYEIDLTGFNTTGITTMANMFQNTFKKGEGIKLNWGTALHTESVTSFSHMFDACTKLVSLNVDHINVNNAAIDYMFCNCQTLQKIPKLIRNSENSISMAWVFYACYALADVDLSEFNTVGANDMSSMFRQCRAAVKLNIGHFDTSSVTNMSYMFDDCRVLEELDLSSFDTSKVTNMAYMFNDCKKLTKLEIRSFDTSEVTNMERMISYCEKLEEVDISSFSKEKLQNAKEMFRNDNLLVTIYANDSFDLSVLTADDGNMFVNSNALALRVGVTDQPSYGKHAFVNGLHGTVVGYFTLKESTSAKLTLSRSSKLALRLMKLAGAVQDNTVTPYADTEEVTSTDDSADYRSSANHGNKTGASDTCDKDHFFVVRTQADIEYIAANYPEQYKEIAGLLTDLKDNEWLYIFTDVVGEGFHVWEENVPDGYESDYDNYEDENGQRITKVENGIAVVTNKLKDLKFGSITISKTVIDSNSSADVSGQVDTKYQFEITLSNTAAISPQTVNAVYYKTDDEENTKTDISVLFVDGKATVEIQSGYSLKFSDLPEGTEYTVKELSDEDVIETKINGAVYDENTINGEIVGDTNISVAYENTVETDLREKGYFKLRKLVQNDNGADVSNAEYSFTIEFTNLLKNTEYSIYNGEEVVKTFTSGSDKTATVVVSLKADDILTFKEIPEDAAYRITEAASSAYISSYVITTGESNANTAVGNELSTQWQTMHPADELTATFTNKIVKVQSVTVSKTVSGGAPETPGEEAKYHFVAQFSNLGAKYQLIAAGIGTFMADEYGNLTVEFYLKSGEAVNFSNIPVGASYSIYEDYDGKLIPCYEITSTDEATGETRTTSTTPTTDTGEDIAKAITEAQEAVDAAQTDYNNASLQLSIAKMDLNSAIADVIALLTDEEKTANAGSIAAFTADSFIDNNEGYKTARDAILTLTDNSSSYKAAITAAEAEVTNSLAALSDASKALQAAQDKLKAARGSSYVEGSVELNKDTAIHFSNNTPFDLTINKKVTGTFGDLQQEFQFKVVFKYNGIPFEGSCTAVLTDGSEVTEKSCTFDADGSVEFVLKDSTSIKFKGLPCGTTYEIVEAEAEDYEVIIDGAVIGNRTAPGTIEGDTAVTFENHWNGLVAELPGAGAVISKKMIYLLGIIMLTEGLIGAVLLYRHRRRKSCA